MVLATHPLGQRNQIQARWLTLLQTESPASVDSMGA